MPPPLAARRATSRPVALLLVGQTVSAWGDGIALVALPLLALEHGGTVATLGLMTGMAGLGQVAGALVLARVSSRVALYPAAWLADLLRALLLLSLPLWWAGGITELALLALALGVGAACGEATLPALLSALVPPEALTRANGLYQAGVGLAYVVGPLLSGAICLARGAATALVLDGLTFLVSAGALLALRLGPRVVPAGATAIGRAPRPALVSRSIAATGLVAFCTVPCVDLWIYHLRRDLALGAGTVGTLLAVASLGAVVAGLTIDALRQRLGLGVAWCTCVAGCGVATAVLCLGLPASLLLAWLLACALSFSCCATAATTLGQVLRQELSAASAMQRSAALAYAVQQGGGAAGALVFTEVAARGGVGLACLFIAAIEIPLALWVGPRVFATYC